MAVASSLRNGYVRYTDYVHTWYRAVLEIDGYRVRTSKRVFERARKARGYGQAVIVRLERMRGGEHGDGTEAP